MKSLDFSSVQNRRHTKCTLITPIEKWGSLLYEDVVPDFQTWTYSYTGSDAESPDAYFSRIQPEKHFCFQSEFFGESIKILAHEVARFSGKDEYFMLINGDVMMAISDINKCFFIASSYKLDIFQPSLSRDSFFSHGHLLNKPGHYIEQVDFTEVMMLGLSSRVWKTLALENKFTISGWGVDKYLLPYLVKREKWKNPCVIHACIARHCKPIESRGLIFSNGKTSSQEMLDLKNSLGF
mgnify:CR=1 FL=1